MTDAVPVSLQCYMGRFELPVQLHMTIRETLRHFQRNVPVLDQVRMGAYVANHNGKLLLEDKMTLNDAQVRKGSVLILVKKSNCPMAASNNEEEEEE